MRLISPFIIALVGAAIRHDSSPEHSAIGLGLFIAASIICLEFIAMREIVETKAEEANQ